MRILLFSPPFSGHLNPILGIGVYLQRFYEVIVVSTESAKDTVESTGLKSISLLKGRDGLIEEIPNPKVQVKNNPFLLYSQFKKNIGLLGDMQKEIIELYDNYKPELIISDFTLFLPGLLANQRNIPWLTTLPSPCVYESNSGVNAYFGGVKQMDGVLGELRDWIHRKITRTFKRGIFSLFKKEFAQLGITSPYHKDGSEVIYSPIKVFALGMKEIEFKRNCRSNFQLVGPVLFTPPTCQQEPIFEEGKKHILITIGTHLWFYKEKMIHQILQTSIELRDIIFHFSYGDKNGNNREINDNFHKYSFVSYDTYMEKYSLVVHHCGTGIMYECIRHGIPSITYPIDYDQFDNSARLEVAGACLRLKELKNLTLCILEILNNAEISKKCLYLKEKYKDYHSLEEIYKYIQSNYS